MKNLVFFLIITNLISCAEESSEVRSNKVDLSKKADQIMAIENMDIDTTKIYNPFALSTLDNYFIVFEEYLENGIFKIFDINNYDLVESFGEVGIGPNQFSKTIAFPVSISNTEKFSIYDWSKKKVHRFNFENKDKFYKEFSYTLPPELLLAQRVAFLDTNIVVSTGGIYDGLIAFTDTKKDSVTYIDLDLLPKKEIDKRKVAEILKSELVIDFKRKKIALASNYIPSIFILDFEGNLLDEINLFEYDLNSLYSAEADEINIYYQSLVVSNDYIYAVFIDKSAKELGKLIDKKMVPMDLTEVHMFDWSGKLIKKFILDTGYTPFISVSKDNSRIHSINRFTNNKINYFEIK